MCSNYRPSGSQEIRERFGVYLSDEYPVESWPGSLAPILRLDAERGGLIAEPAYFGLLPVFAKDTAFCRTTYNARSETVAQKPSFRQAWAKGQFCLIPAERIYEPCYESGSAVRWSIASRAEGGLCVAGLWSRWRNPKTDQGHMSFTMLTLNADAHDLMRRFHKPDDEKRMVYIVPPDDYDRWLTATPDLAHSMIQPYPATLLQAEARPLPPHKPVVQAALDFE